MFNLNFTICLTQEKEGYAMEVKYELVKQTLRQEIISGKYQINEKLPTESQLMARFNVSRYTIRRAVGELENEHYIYRVQGGWDVRPRLAAPLVSRRR